MPLSPTYIKLASTTLASTASSVTFSSITSGYTDLILIASPIQTGSEDIRCQVNSDTGSNYSTTILTMNSSGGGASARRTSQTAATVGFYQSGLNTSHGAPLIIQFMNYSNTSTFKSWLSRSGQGDRNSLDTMVSLYRNLSAITSITLFNNNSTGTHDFHPESSFSLYGIKKA